MSTAKSHSTTHRSGPIPSLDSSKCFRQRYPNPSQRRSNIFPLEGQFCQFFRLQRSTFSQRYPDEALFFIIRRKINPMSCCCYPHGQGWAHICDTRKSQLFLARTATLRYSVMAILQSLSSLDASVRLFNPVTEFCAYNLRINPVAQTSNPVASGVYPAYRQSSQRCP